MNATLSLRYTPADLAANAWCRDANAAIAAYWLSTRRGLAAPAHLQQQYDAYTAILGEIAAGRQCLPEAPDRADNVASVTNFTIALAEPWQKAQRVDEAST